MRFIVNKTSLLQALKHARIMVPQGLAVSYFWGNQYRFCVTEKSLSVSGTNGSMFITETVPLDETELGLPVSVTSAEFLVPFKFKKAIESLEEQLLEFVIEEYQLTVRHSSGYFRVQLTNAVFPEPRPIQETGAIHLHMEAPGLRSQLSKVAFACAEDELRPVMSGIFVEIESEQIIFVASDGHILMRLIKKCQEQNEQTGTFILPRDVANTILKILPKTGYCELYYHDNSAKLMIDDYLEIQFRCIEGRYPNYRNVITTDFNSVFSVEKRTLLKIINRLYLFSGYSTQAVKIALSNTPQHDYLTLSSKCVDEDAMAQEKIACEFSKGVEYFEQGIMFKIPLLTRVLNNVPAEKLIFNTKDSSSACIITPVPGSDVEELTALVMPLMQTEDDEFDSL